MEQDPRTMIMDALTSDAHRARIAKGHRLEEVSGGGILKHLERVLTAPDLYLPYVLHAKLGLARYISTTVTLFWGRKVAMPLTDYDAFILHMYGGLYGSELKFTKFLARHLKANDVFYDIGANRGFYTFLAADLTKEIHTFEAVESLARIVSENIRPEDTITVSAAAVSDKDGTTDFYIMDSTMTNTIDPTVAEHLAAHAHPISKKVTVPAITLDTYVSTHTKPTFLKIDVEGAEAQVIEGGRTFFSENAPLIAMEIWGKENRWELSMQAAEKLRSMGYRSYRVTEEGDMEEATGDLSKDVPAQGGDNYVFKK